MTSSKSWQSFSNLLDALELLPDDEDNMNSNESINANLAPRKRSDASLTKEQQDELRREIKSSSQNDMLMRRMLFDDPRHELITQQNTKSRKNDDSIDHSAHQQLQVPIVEVMTATKGEEEEVEQFDPQAFLDDLIYGNKKGSTLDKKKPIDSTDTDTKKVEPISFSNNNRLNKADEYSENDSISLPSSNDSFKDGDDCWLSWPKPEDDSEVR